MFFILCASLSRWHPPYLDHGVVATQSILTEMRYTSNAKQFTELGLQHTIKGLNCSGACAISTAGIT